MSDSKLISFEDTNVDVEAVISNNRILWVKDRREVPIVEVKGMDISLVFFSIEIGLEFFRIEDVTLDRKSVV
jgi:hypothetical protein